MPGEASRKLKEELFGLTVVLNSSDVYIHISMMRELHMMPLIEEWEYMDIHVRAKILAHYQLNAMVEVLRRHDQIMQDRAKKLAAPKKGRR